MRSFPISWLRRMSEWLPRRKPTISETVEKVLGPDHKRSVTRFTCFRCHKTQLGGYYCHHCGAPLDKTAKLAADAAEWRRIADRGVTLKAGTVLTTSDGSPPAVLMYDYAAAKFDEVFQMPDDERRDAMLRRHGLQNVSTRDDNIYKTFGGVALLPLAALSKMFWWADCGMIVLLAFVGIYMISEWRRRNVYDKPPGFKSERDSLDEVRRHTARNKLR